MRRGFALSGLQFKEYMYVDDNKKGHSFSSFGGYLLLGGGGHRTGKQGGNYNELRCFADKQAGRIQGGEGASRSHDLCAG